MLPLAKRNIYVLNNGFTKYIKRRACRILPPYYICLFFSIIIFAIFPISNGTAHWNIYLPNFDFALGKGDMLAYLLLIQNLKNIWIYNINTPMWSIAAEWQIYFIFPLLILPLAKKIGILSSAIVVFIITSAPYIVSFTSPAHNWGHGFRSLWSTHPWYIGLFSFGMLGACINYNNSYKYMKSLHWHIISMIAIIPFLYIAFFRLRYINNYMWLCDLSIGISVMSALIYN